ncbi:uncharacterized protein N7479_001853 [Penicillium vulpinum]|uniref:uncharacterized protein n=1 Tax=Penicillium vulpinum TaxID=29845 RepID=UPI002549082E|nr:uncharacterized protein N7479_001853 [Penicillium vulpinum]KAJ5971935.1 hypothetical protein N7479_001853 [Penicillium vulpinum]
MGYAATSTEEAFPPACVEKYELALKTCGKKIRAVLLVNPHNPVGRCYPVETLKAITRFCNSHSLHFISDEVYASCVFDSGDPEAVPFTSTLSLNSTDRASLQPIRTYNLCAQQGGNQLCQGRVSICTRTRRYSNPPLIRSITRNAGGFYIDLSPYLPTGSALPPRLREFALAQMLVDVDVFLHPGEEHSQDIGWFRLVFSQEEETFKGGLNRRVLCLLLLCIISVG